MNKLFILVSIFVVFCFAISCENEKVEVPNPQPYLSYFPLETGNWVEYEVDSVVHYDSDDFYNVDTAIGNFHFYLREVVDSSFTDGEDETAYLINRYKREYDSLPWELINVWSAKVDNYSAQRVEDNVRFLRLEFPLNSSADWNGNAYNFFPEEEYSYDEMYEPRQYGSLYFDSTITVMQNDFTSQINRIYKKEIYGAHAGLLFKEIDSVNTKNTSNGTIILNGLEYKFNINGYNN
jgi:hypothetical protein